MRVSVATSSYASRQKPSRSWAAGVAAQDGTGGSMCVEGRRSLERFSDSQICHYSFILLCFYYDEMYKTSHCRDFQGHNSVALITHTGLYNLHCSLVPEQSQHPKQNFCSHQIITLWWLLVRAHFFSVFIHLAILDVALHGCGFIDWS